jgi:hypothetical protein
VSGGSCSPRRQAQALSGGGGHSVTGLQLLQEALSLGGFAQEPPVVIGISC